ncbi:MAG: hypothetical protein ACYDBV_14365, partial [Nitrospiria bacterium]
TMQNTDGRVTANINYDSGDNQYNTFSTDYLVHPLDKLTVWRYWQDYYYPRVIKESYPVYIQERSMDKGQKAFEILKILGDKKIIKLEKVSDFIDAMDCLIKIL